MSRVPVIAIVDDDREVRHALAELVEALGFEGCAFAGAEALLGAMAPGAFDCVISDIRMPGLDGLELQRQLAALEPRLPLIFVTSVCAATVLHQAKAQGAVAVLQKPIDAADLERALREALARR